MRDGVRASVVHAYPPAIDGLLTSVGVAAEANAVYSKMSARKARIAIRCMLMGASEHYKIILDAGEAVTSIQKVAERENPDLLILGTRGQGRLRRALFGSVASRVTAVANSDVLVIPEGPTSASARFSVHSPGNLNRNNSIPDPRNHGTLSRETLAAPAPASAVTRATFALPIPSDAAAPAPANNPTAILETTPWGADAGLPSGPSP